MRLQLALGGLAVALGVWAQLQFGEAPADAAVAVPPAAVPRDSIAPPPPSTPVPVPAPSHQPLAAAPSGAAPARPPLAEEALTVEQAQALMREAAEQGERRQPPAGGLRPRPAATPAQLADPKQYAAFEDAGQRREVQAWTLGLQQIPHIRERIDQAAQSGERSAAELAEANQALEQLEQLQQHLRQSDPSLLPTGAASPD
ncbi:hypothetical protein AAFN46_12780 [Pseudomonas sp. CAU 1711]|uniref:hypothetical protein n=1 Tax=Pseudomonas sp. CAU 1711 TaxID=3140356 RepID=UPI003260AA83